LEIEYGTFHRQVRLAEDVDPNHATAGLEHGVLTIVLPVVATAPTSGRFTIEVHADERLLFDSPEPSEHELELPAALPVLPLKETVVSSRSR